MRTTLLVMFTCGIVGACGGVPPSEATSTQEAVEAVVGEASNTTPRIITSPAELTELLAHTELPVVIDFWAGWCLPCRRLAPEMDTLATTNAGKAIVVKVDTDALPLLVEQYDVQTLPTILVFRAGAETKRLTGTSSTGRIAEALSL